MVGRYPIVRTVYGNNTTNRKMATPHLIIVTNSVSYSEVDVVRGLSKARTVRRLIMDARWLVF